MLKQNISLSLRREIFAACDWDPPQHAGTGVAKEPKGQPLTIPNNSWESFVNETYLGYLQIWVRMTENLPPTMSPDMSTGYP